jgi:AraC-like DNA-binding protein
LQQEIRQPEQAQVNPDNTTSIIRTGMLDTGWHHHAVHQLIYAEDGVLYVLTEKQQFLLPAYHGAWIPARCAHKLISPSEETRLWLLYIHPEEDEIPVFQSVRIFGVSPLAREMILYTERWADEEDRSVDGSLLAQRFYETIRLLAAEWCEEPLQLILPHTEDRVLGSVTQYILDYIGEPLTIQAVAQIHGVSGRTLMRLFRSQLGITFGTYLRIARVVKAVEMLTTPSVSIIEVAHNVGYNSPSSFSQAFRRLIGMSPQEYRRSLIKD